MVPKNEKDALSEISVRSHYLLWSCVALIIVAILWAGFAKIDEVTRGTGKVIPAGKVQVVQHLEGGIVEKILVREGQTVAQGQTLMEIDDVQFGALYREGLLRAAAAAAKIARLSAEARNTPFEVRPQFENEYANLVRNERELYEANKKTLETKLFTLEQRVKQKEQEFATAHAKIEKLKRSFDLVNQEFKMTQSLFEEGAASKVEVLRLERQANDLSGELRETELTAKRSSQAITEAKNQLNELEDSLRSEATRELSVAKAELASQEEANNSLRDRAKRTILQAPVNGTIKTIHVNTIGGTVKPGQDLIEIVPTDDSLVIEAGIRPKDVAFLHPDQPAIVKLTAYDFLIYGSLKGKLEHIGADTILDERGNSFYLIRIRTDKNHLGTENKPLPIIPGMMAEVDIITGKKTVLSYLLKPLLRGKEKALRER